MWNPQINRADKSAELLVVQVGGIFIYHLVLKELLEVLYLWNRPIHNLRQYKMYLLIAIKYVNDVLFAAPATGKWRCVQGTAAVAANSQLVATTAAKYPRCAQRRAFFFTAP